MRKSILACCVTALAVGATSATAASVITSDDIKDETIQNRDMRDGAFTWSKFAPTTQNKIAKLAAPQNSAASTSPAAGTAGPAGPQGPQGLTGEDGDDGEDGTNGTNGENGAQGIQGEQGAPGQALVANETTETTEDSPGGLPIVPIEDKSIDSQAPNSGDRGTPLVSVTLDAGLYLATTTAQFLNLNPANPTESFGVARLFTESPASSTRGTNAPTVTEGGTIWSNRIPNSMNNLAQTTATTVLEIEEDGTVVTLSAVSRGQSGTFAGANLVVTSITEATDDVE